MAILSGGSFTGLIPQIPTLDDLALPLSQCSLDSFDLLQTNSAFQNPLAGPISDCLAEIANILAVSGFTSGPEFDLMNQLTDVFGGGTFDLGGGVVGPGLLGHSNGLSSSLPALMGQSTSFIRSY